MFSSFRPLVAFACALFATQTLAPTALASGHIDACTLIATPQGTFNGVQYIRYEALFEGVTSHQHPYRVPCQIVAPLHPCQGSGVLLFDWLVASTIFTAVGQEQADARYGMTDAFLFGTGAAYATVRCDPLGIGARSPVASPFRPWSDGQLDTSSEFIVSAGDEFDIVVDYVRALRTDLVARQCLGPIHRRAAFGYSASGSKLRGLLRLPIGRGLFDFSLVGGTGDGFDRPVGNVIDHSNVERAPLNGAGLEIDFQTETDVIALNAHRTRHTESNYRVYQFAGAAHIRSIDCVEFGLPDPLTANTADWTPFIRALFVAGNRWCGGILPPPSLWLGAPNDPQIVRDAKGNALVRYVGGAPVNTGAYRLPEVAVGQNQYVPLAPQFNDGSFPGLLRMLSGSHVDLTAQFASHATYVQQVTLHARHLQALGYLRVADADAIIQRAAQANIGA